MLSIHSELRSPNAVSRAPTRAIAPPQWRTITSVSPDGRRSDQSTVVSVAASLKPSRYSAFHSRRTPAGKSGSSARRNSRYSTGPLASSSGVASSRSARVACSPAAGSPAHIPATPT